MLTNSTERHLTSPLGDTRERSVPCGRCARPTFNVCAMCGRCCVCPDAGVLEDITTVLAENAAHAMTRNVHTVMDDVIDSIPDGTDPETARSLRGTVGMARLMADVADEHPRSHSAWQMLSSTLAAVQAKSKVLVTGVMVVLMLAVGLVVAPVGTPNAAAAVTAASQAASVTVAGATVRVPVRVTVSARNRVTGWYQASLWVGNRIAGYGQAKTPTFVVTATIPTMLAPQGTAIVTARDENDGKCRTMRVTVLRRTSLTGTMTVAGYGITYVTATVKHWTGTAWVPSRLSPIIVQRQANGAWVNVRTLTTGTTGTASGYVALPAGAQYVRLLRPVGSTVTAASTSPMLVRVPSPAGEGCVCEGPGAGD